jgi:hypothetical protein
VPADVDHRWFVRGAKQVMAAIHRPRERRRQHEQRLKADAAYDLDFFRLAPRLTARRLPRHSAFGRAALPPLTQTSLEEDSTRPRKTSPDKRASFTSPFWDGGGERPPGWFFLPTKTIPFFLSPPGGVQKPCTSSALACPATIRTDPRGRLLPLRSMQNAGVWGWRP